MCAYEIFLYSYACLKRIFAMRVQGYHIQNTVFISYCDLLNAWSIELDRSSIRNVQRGKLNGFLGFHTTPHSHEVMIVSRL